MQIGIVGLGRMGANIARRLMRGGHSVVGYDTAPEMAAKLEGATPAIDLAALVKALAPPRIVWVMVPAGKITEGIIETLGGVLASGDTIIDGGNAYYKDDVRRARALAARG